MSGQKAQSELPDLSAETWQIAPIRWSGTTTTSANQFQTSDGSKSLTTTNNLNLQANSFFVAPYIADWTGMLGANSSSGTSTPALGQKVKSESSGLNIGGIVNVFPMSRFPFSANFNHGSSQSRASELSNPSTSTQFGLRQQYRTEDGLDNYSATFNRNEISSSGSGQQDTSSVNNYSGSYATNRSFEIGHVLEGNHNLTASVGGSTAKAGALSENGNTFSANVNHGWVVHEDLSINNLLTFASSAQNTFQGTSFTKNNSNVLLGSSAVTWRPLEEIPLTLNGGGNFTRTETGTGATTSEQNSFSGFVSTSYRFNNNLSAGGNVSVSATQNDGKRNIFNSQGANVSWAGDPVTISEFNYGWGASGNLSRTGSSSAGNTFSTGASINHSLGRSFILSESSGVNANVGQGLSINNGSQGATTGLSHSAGVGWRASYGEQLSANLSATASLTNSSGAGGSNQFKSASLLGGGTYQISGRAAVTASANLTWSQTIADATPNQLLNGVSINSNSPQSNGSFSLAYTHQSPFSIRNLNYTGTLMRLQSFSNQTVVGAGAQPISDKGSTSIQQLADYRAGRLIFRLNHSWIDQAGRKSASIFGSVTREFDGFFDGRW